MLHARPTRGGIFETVVTAGLVLTIVLSGCLHSSNKPLTPASTLVVATRQPTPSSTTVVATMSPTPTQPAAFPLAGTWTGNAKNSLIEMQVTITLQTSCQVGFVCGTFDVRIYPCSGTFILVGEQNSVYEFQAGGHGSACGMSTGYVQLLPDGTLQFSSQGDFGQTTGILVRNNPTPSATPTP